MDENAPPGYLSPFGLLAGIRNMLPGGGKDLRTPDTESPNRPVLRDVNSSDGPKPKNLLNVAQGPEGSAPPSPASLSVSVTGDCSLVSSPGQERRSVASDTSFVSAVSEYGRAERPESDSSDSCFESSYVSAAESSGNISFLGDQFSKLVLNSPAPHSNFLNGSSEKPSVKSLNFWPGEELSADETITVDNGTAFGQIEREDPVDTLEEANSVTINNQTCSGSSYSDLDATFEDVHGNDDVNRTQILNEKSPSLENASEKNCLNGTEFVPVQSDHVEEASVNKTDPSSDESAVESGLNSTFTGNSETPSNISVGVEEVTVQACSEESVDSAQPITTENPGINVTFDGVPLGVEENSTGNETVSTEDLNNSEWRDLVSANQTFSPTVPCQDEIITTENVNVNVSADVVPVGVEENFTCSETINTEDLNNSEWRDLVSDSKFLSEEDVGQAEEEIDPTPSDNVNDCQDVPQHSQGADEIPLPIRKPRTFEEILAAELAAQSDPENAVPSFSDEIPIKKPRTFEEILAAELAAQSDPEQAAPSFPENSETPSDINVTSVNVPVGEDTNLTEEEKHEASGLESVNSALPGPTEHSSINVAFDGVSAGDQKNLCKNEAAAAVDPVSEPLFHPQDDVCQADKETISHHSDAVSPEQDFPHHDQNADEIPLPIKTPRTFEEILAAELAAQSDPENAVPSFSDEIPLPIKKPRTFEEILAAELAAQSDPEQAVPSFSASPRKLDESFANIISADTSPLESECEPELVLDSVPAELDSEADSGLESLIQRAKQQEKDLEENLQSVSEEASQISSSYLNESERACSITSEELESPDCANQTVIELQADTSRTNSEVASEVQAQVSASLGDSTEGENLDAEEFESGDAFKDPSAFDFLSLHGCTRSARDLRKESLYVKFDPLVGSYTSDTRGDNSLIMHPENSSETQAGAACGQEQALNTSVKLVSLSPSASKQQAEETAQDATLITPIKTMPSRGTPVKTPAHIMLNETLESIGSRGTLVKQEDLIKKLQEHQAVLEEQDKAYQERISELEQRLQEMDIRRAEERDKEVKEKDKELQEKVQSLSELNVIMKEYEKTISRLVAEKSQEKAALEEKQVELVKDRDQAQQHLNNMEIAFSDIHTKYERLKSVVTALKKNEETLNAALAEKQENFDKMQNMYDMLKSHAVSKLEKANQDLESIKQKHQQENSKLKAMVKKLEVKTKSLEEALEQKVKENQALTAICDELINKVGE